MSVRDDARSIGVIEEVISSQLTKSLSDKALKSAYEMNIAEVDKSFGKNCPLWTYILAEAMHNKEAEPQPARRSDPEPYPKLGPVGGRIVAEVTWAYCSLTTVQC